MISNYALLGVVITMASASHLMLRAGMAQVGRVGADELGEPLALLAKILTTPLVMAAVPIYAASFAGWTIALSRLQLSLAYPALAMTYVFIPLLSWALLHEPVSALQWTGIVVICVGVVMVLRSGLS
jgi:drug/metabolite transporter (DMT)-like permease